MFNIPYSFIPFELDTLTEIIIFSQQNATEIKKEYHRLSAFYRKCPGLLREQLMETEDYLTNEKMIRHLSEFEELSLKEINNIKQKSAPLESMFKFNNDFFIDDYRKIFVQIGKKGIPFLKENKIVDIIYYGLSDKINEDVPLGESFSNGDLNTGSLIVLKILRINHREIISKYQTLLN